MKAGRKRRGNFLAREERAKRESARERLCDDDDVRQSREALVGKRLPCAPQAALNFVGDERGSTLRREVAGAHPEFIANGINSAFPLNRLDDHGAHFIRELGFEVREIIQTDKIHSRHQRLERFTVFYRMSDRKRAERAYVKSVVQPPGSPLPC